MLVLRGGDYLIEMLDETYNLDSALKGESVSAKTTWAGLDHLEGLSVSIVADGQVVPDQTVTSGAITLSEAANEIEVGLAYSHIIEPLPPNALAGAGASRKVRLIEAIFRLQGTAALRLDVGRGLGDVSLKQIGEDDILDAPPPLVSGDVRVRALGWQADATKPLWRVEQSAPLPFTLLSVSTELKVND